VAVRIKEIERRINKVFSMNGSDQNSDTTDPCVGCRLYRFEGENEGTYHEVCGMCSRFFPDLYESKLEHDKV
jgi:hypothetical protein